MSKQRQSDERITVAVWACRVCFALVFIVNIQCALSYVVMPESFTGGFQLSGIPGVVAVQGIGVAFLMWNATYPAFIVSPLRFKTLGIVVVIQQIIGLVGESVILLDLPSMGYAQLAESISRFILFDALGLVIMAASLAFLFFVLKRISTIRK